MAGQLAAMNYQPLALLLGLAVGMPGCSKTESTGDDRALNRGLVGGWSAADFPADKGGSLSRALTGSVEIVSERTSKVFSFEGPDGKLVVPNSARLNFRTKQDFSICAWIRPARAETSFGVMSIVDKREVAGIGAALGYSLHLADGRLACQLAPAGRWQWQINDFTSVPRIRSWWQRRNQMVPMIFASFVAPGPDLRDGRFHHVALTVQRVSPTGGKLYVDGTVVLVFNPTKQAASLVNRAPLLIGNHQDPSLKCAFVGQVSEVRIYSHALSATGVQSLWADSGLLSRVGHQP
jgi:hypothetical protein